MQITTTPTGRTFTLNMSEQEAGILRSVVGRISGLPSGPRGFTSAVFDALTKLHVRSVGNLGDSSLSFREELEL